VGYEVLLGGGFEGLGGGGVVKRKGNWGKGGTAEADPRGVGFEDGGGEEGKE
jgi:hypothetical protein